MLKSYLQLSHHVLLKLANRKKLYLILYSLILVFVLIGHNSTIGVIWKDNEDTQTLPVANKGCYRRSIMEVRNAVEMNIAYSFDYLFGVQILRVIKDTSREFVEYVESSKNRQKEQEKDETGHGEKIHDGDDGGNGDEDSDDFFDDMDEEEPYSEEEVIVVERAVELMTMSHRVVRYSLDLITSLSECAIAIHSKMTTTAANGDIKADSNSSVFTIDDHASSSSFQIQVYQFVQNIDATCCKIKQSVNYLGCELYSPFALDKVYRHEMELLSYLNEILNCAGDMLSVMLTKTIELVMDTTIISQGSSKLSELRNEYASLELIIGVGGVMH